MARQLLLIGSGLSAQAAATLALSKGWSVILVDDRPLEQNLQQGLEKQGVAILPAAALDLGNEAVDLLVPSPAVPMSHPVLRAAKAAAAPVLSEISFARNYFNGHVTGITGSNGKTTTTALCAHLLQAGGLHAMAAGNIGLPFSQVVHEHPDVTHAVLEISSYQLESTEALDANCALLLNLSPDHLARHGDLKTYGQTKARLAWQLKKDGVLIMRDQDPFFVDALRDCPNGKLLFGQKASCAIWREGEQLHFPEAGRHRWLHAGDLRLKGPHNLDNMMAAALAAHCAGVGADLIAEAACAFEPLPHRLEVINTDHPATWVNDSKATNLDATLVAIRSFGGGRLILLIGGVAKGPDVTPLNKALGDRQCLVICFGADGKMLQSGLTPAIPSIFCSDLEQAVHIGASESHKGDTVLLSPMCASFDQYRNFEERGEHFRQLLQEFSS